VATTTVKPDGTVTVETGGQPAAKATWDGESVTSVLVKAAWEFMKSPAIGLWHEDGTDGAGHVVESYVYRGPDWVIKAGDAEHTVQAGDWLLGIRWSEETWPLVKSGKIGGVSPQGRARRRTPSPEAVAALRS
jgi:hypothetical protein